MRKFNSGNVHGHLAGTKKYYWHNNTIYWGRKQDYLIQYQSRQDSIPQHQSYNTHQVLWADLGCTQVQSGVVLQISWSLCVFLSHYNGGFFPCPSKKYYWHNNTIYWGRKLEYFNQCHSKQGSILLQQVHSSHQVFPPTHPCVSITSDMSWPVKAAGSCVVGQLQATLPYLWWSLAKEGRVDHK